MKNLPFCRDKRGAHTSGPQASFQLAPSIVGGRQRSKMRRQQRWDAEECGERARQHHDDAGGAKVAAQPTRSVGFFPRVAAWKLPEAKASEGRGLGKHRRALFASSDRLVVTTCLRCSRSLEGPVQPHPSCGAVIGSASAEISIHRDTVTDQSRGGSGGKSLGSLAGRRSACPHEHKG